jgi:alpha-tubulin suppressor-like RCC1 family protein
MNKGKVYTFGLGKNGELGTASKSTKEILPYQVTKLPPCISVSAGGSFSLILTSTGEVLSSGKGKHGRTGLGDERNVSTFTRVPINTRITQISAGYWHSLLLDSDFQVWSCGYNNYGQLGINSTISSSSFLPTGVQASMISAGGHVSLCISLDSKLLSCGKISGHPSNPSRFSQVAHLDEVTFIDAGQVHVACISSGRLFTWGNNTWGQLGHSGTRSVEVPTQVNTLQGVAIVKVSCSKGEKNASTGCIDCERRVFMWGSGYKGKLGLDSSWSHEDPADRLNPEMIQGFLADSIELGGIHSSAISEGRVFTWGCGSDGRIGHPEVEGHRYLYKEPLPRPIDGLTGAIQISSSYYHNIILS